MLAREPAVAVGIAKALTPRGRVSHRAIPAPYSTRSLRAQWGIGQDTRLLCLGNYVDGYLERLWAAQAGENAWGHLQALGFDAATSLNFSIYLDRPRLEHLVNIKRSWLTVRRMQETSGLVPIPHLQWATILDLERQLRYAQEQGFHTLALNLQMIKRQGWDTVAAGLPVIREQAPEIRLLFAGVASLRRMAQLATLFPTASFTNTTAHYLAQRHVRLRRDGMRLIKEPVDGHPDLILAENVRLYRDFVAEARGQSAESPAPSPQAGNHLYAAQQEVAAALQARFGYDPEQAATAAERLAVDEAILAACQHWLRTGSLDRDFQGSFPDWPCAGCVPHPTLGDLLDGGRSPARSLPAPGRTWPARWTRRSRPSPAWPDIEGVERWVGQRAQARNGPPTGSANRRLRRCARRRPAQVQASVFASGGSARAAVELPAETAGQGARSDERHQARPPGAAGL